MDIDDLKNNWRNFTPPETPSEQETRKMALDIARGRVLGSQRRLARHYVESGIAALCIIALSPTIFTVLGLPLWSAAIYAFFGILLTAINFSLVYHINHAHYLSLPVVSALSKIVALRSRLQTLHIAANILSISIIAMLVAQAVFAANGYALLIGFAIGIAIGIPIDILRWRRSKRLVRELQLMLQSTIAEN